MIPRRKRRLPVLAFLCLAGGLAGVAAAWALAGFGPPARVDPRLVLTFGAVGILLPVGLSVFNVFWKETLYQNLSMAGALAFGWCFDLVFVTALALGAAWAGGISADPSQVLAWCAQPYVLCGLVVGALAWFLWHFIQMVRLVLGKGQLGRFLTGQRKYPVHLECFVLVVELEDPPPEIIDTGAPRYLSYLNDFYQEVETVARSLGGEIIAYTTRGIQVTWPETKGGSNNQPLYCVFELRRRIRGDRAWYQVVYRTVPHFRTALHFGAVVSAEMGWSSRQIRTQGEAVEIAGRLAQSCPKLKENFLVSEPAMDRLVLPAGSRIHRSVAAQIPGSETNMRLYALEQIEK